MQDFGHNEAGRTSHAEENHFDVVAVGAGFAGLYLIHSLRRAGFSVRVFESADDVGGTWYWNRYPGARCDIESIDYSYSFDAQLEREWKWSERYATQPEILRYLGHVADRFDLRRDIRFETRVASAQWDERAHRWQIRTDKGDIVTCRFYVMATGCLSLPKAPDITGAERFRGEAYYTGRWPRTPVSFAGKRVAVIGTGSSAIQAIPVIASEAATLTVFQRTPNYSRPAKNGPVSVAKKALFDRDPAAYRQAARMSAAGVPRDVPMQRALQVSDAERQARFEAAYESGDLLAFNNSYADIMVNEEANATIGDFLRAKIASIVHDPETAETLTPRNHLFGTKRPCIDTNYYETFNLPHVKLVDLRRDPIRTITERGIDTANHSFEFDTIVYATGFDAMTGALIAVDITGRDGRTLKDVWAAGPKTYLGLTIHGFPNFFAITGPGSPSVLSNMVVSIEQHVDWITECLSHMRTHAFDTIEPTTTAQQGWVQHVNDSADISLFPRANSWYMGANVPGKPRVFLPYIGGCDRYRTACNEVVQRGYLGFEFEGANGRQCNDGVIRRVQPDAQAVIDFLREMGAPPIESLGVDVARRVMAAGESQRPPGPEVGEVRDGTLPGPGGDLRYRIYRPATDGPHGAVVYFHGGGFVLGSESSDDPLCRYLCRHADAVVISVNYRHAPEAPFPAAIDDGVAAIRWIADHAGDLGFTAGRLALCGWSAGANITAVACQILRDSGGPAISGQVLITPPTDWDQSRASYKENGDAYILTNALMRWFRNHYAPGVDASDPRLSPLRHPNLANLPPALVVTCEFDPLRDEGAAYAEALANAGNDAKHLPCRGQIHTSIPAVDLVISANDARQEIASTLKAMLKR